MVRVSRSLAFATVLAIFTASVAVSAHAAPAGLRSFCADRPGKATPPCILDAGHLQLEIGLVDYSRQHEHGARANTYAVGASELRVGVSKRSEIEIGWTPWAIERTRDITGANRHAGVGDLVLGVRTALTNPDSGGAAVSLRPFVTAPTATHHMGTGGWEGGVMLPISASLPQQWSLGLMPEVDVARNASGRGTHPAWSGTVAMGHALGPVALGAEIWGAVDEDPIGRTRRASFDLTAAWTPPSLTDVQFDGGVNAGLNSHTPSLELYAGVSRRF